MSAPPRTAAGFSDYLELTKPRLSLLSVLTALVGYAAVRPSAGLMPFVWMAIGTSLAAAGVAALNQCFERDTDAQMERTAQRPIPAGRIPEGTAFVLGWLLCIAALMLTFALVNGLSALFVLLTIISYLGCYTPAKRWSRWSTEIGAVAGAFPPLIGWAAAEGRVSALGWILFGILFFWQIPHFMAVSWTHRRDYAAVKFPLTTVRDQTGHAAAICSLINTVFLLIVSLLPIVLHLDTVLYGAAAAACGLRFLWLAVRFLRTENRDLAARKLFIASIVYLPLVLGALVADRLIFFR